MKRLRAIVGSVLIVLAAWAFWKLPDTGLVSPFAFWNTSPSVPIGLYVWVPWADPETKGSIVAVRDPPHFYLWWLMKRVEGVGGDRYCWDSALGTQTLNGRPMPPPWPKAIDMGIPVWHGCKVLEPHELVGYGQTPDSYDSRYFGPIRVEQLWGVYTPVWLVAGSS